MSAPISAQTIMDAGTSVPMQTITFHYEDPGDATKTADCVLSRIEWDARYELNHVDPVTGIPDHIDLPVGTFVVLRIMPDADQFPIPVWVYGGTLVTFTITDDGMGNPIPDPVTGVPTYIFAYSGMPGPDLSGGRFFPAGNSSQVSANIALDSPWGERGEQAVFSINFLAGGLDPARWGIDTFADKDVLLRPAALASGGTLVPIQPWDLTVNGKTRSHLGGSIRGPFYGDVQFANIKIVNARIERKSRVMTYDSIVVPTRYDDAHVSMGPEPGGLERGMFIRSTGGGYGHYDALTQIAAVDSGSVSLSSDLRRFAGVLFCDAVQVGGSIIVATGLVECATTDVHAGQQVTWGIYDELTGLWSAGTEVIGEVDKVIDVGSFWLKLTDAQKAMNRWDGAPTCWIETFYAHDGAVTVDGTDGAINVAGTTGTGGYTTTVS